MKTRLEIQNRGIITSEGQIIAFFDKDHQKRVEQMVSAFNFFSDLVNRFETACYNPMSFVEEMRANALKRAEFFISKEQEQQVKRHCKDLELLKVCREIEKIV